MRPGSGSAGAAARWKRGGTIEDTLFWAGCAVVVLIVFGLFLGPIFWTGVVWLGIGAVLAGGASLSYHGVLWLLDGTWAGWSFGAALAATGQSNPPPTSGGANGIVQAIMALPVAAGIIGVGFLLWWIGAEGRAVAKRREGETRSRSGQ